MGDVGVEVPARTPRHGHSLHLLKSSQSARDGQTGTAVLAWSQWQQHECHWAGTLGEDSPGHRGPVSFQVCTATPALAGKVGLL